MSAFVPSISSTPWFGSLRATLKKAHTSDIGDKLRVSDEAIDAGDTSLISNGLTLPDTSITDTLNTMMVEALAKATGGLSLGVHSFHGVVFDGVNPTPVAEYPWASIVAAKSMLRCVSPPANRHQPACQSHRDHQTPR